MGVTGAAAEVDDVAGEDLAGAVERVPREAGLAGSLDNAGGLDGGSGSGQVLEEPTSTKVDVTRRRRRLVRCLDRRG